MPKLPTPALAAAFALVLAAPAAEAQFAYQPGAHRYRLEQVMTSTQEAMGQTMTNTMTTVQVIAVQLAPAGDSLAVTFTLDSARITAEVPQLQAQAQAEIDKVMGRRISGHVSPRGHMGELQVEQATDSVGDEALAAGFRNFFPRMPAAAIQAGTSWTDTTSTTFNTSGIEGTATSVVTYTIEGDTTVSGRQAWRVAQKGTVTTNGMGNSQGQELALSGGGTIEGVALVAKDGLYLGSESQLDQSMTVQVVAMGMEVPLTQSIRSEVRMVE